MRLSYLTTLAVFCCAPVAATAQKPADLNWDAARVSCTLRYTAKAEADPQRLRAVVLIPKTLPGRQKVLKIDYSAEPSKTFEQDGNMYAEWTLENPARATELVVTVDAELYRHGLAVATADKTSR
jgi:hypothetical protein